MDIRRIRTALLTAALLAGSGLPAVQAQNPGATSAPANRIVGHWTSDVALGSCQGGPAFVRFVGFTTYHAGGTLSDTNNTPSALRSPGHGSWKYLGDNSYATRFQIFRFLPSGQYDGYADIRTTTVLAADGETAETEVHARNFNPDGSFRGELCGVADGNRVSID